MSKEIVTPVLNLDKCSVLILDVAGTTTSNSFLQDTLFSYVDKQVETFMKDKWEDDAVKEAVKTLKEGEVEQEEAITLVKELTKKNSDNVGLKNLQGLIYKKGYESGELKAHVYPDVPATIESLAKSRKVAIFSTGSEESQKLLFKHTTEGDLSKYISKYFDQSAGSKTEPGTYEKIVKDLGVKAEETVFITDSVEEAKAAKTAGLIASLITREGSEKLPEDAVKDFPVISSFQDIVLEKAVKRKNEEDAPPAEVERPTKVAKKEENGVETPAKEVVADEAMEVDAAAIEIVEPVKEKADDAAKETPKVKADEILESKTEEKTATVTEDKLTEPIKETKTEDAKIDTNVEEKCGKTADKDPLENKVDELKVGDGEDKTQKKDTNNHEEKMDVTPCDKVESEENEIKTSDDKVATAEEKSNESKVATDSETSKVATDSETSKVAIDSETSKVPTEKVSEPDTSKVETEKVPESDSKGVTEKIASAECEAAPAEKPKQDKVEDKETKDSKVATEEKKVIEETKTPTTDDKKVEVKEKVDNEEKEKSDVSKESEAAKVAEKKDESAKSTEKKEETDKKEGKAENSELEKKEEAKVDAQEEKTNGEEKIEKENKSVLANGVEKEATNGTTSEEKKGETSEAPEEIKVKKIEEVPAVAAAAPESAPVSVEA